MKKVFVIGGAGKVGRKLIDQLTKRGHQTHAMYRNAAQVSELQSLGAIPVEGNLLKLDAERLSKLMEGSDVVVFTAGAGGKGGMEMTNAIDGKGLELAIEASKLANIKRFLLVSVFPEALRGKEVSETFENYMVVKKQADVILAATDLDWVILRPGTLLDSSGTGKINAGLAIPYGEVSREDVAATLVEIIEQPQLNRIIIELTQGHTPVKHSIQQLINN